ncbi:hypothetical protein [Caldilinea sp.]|jgi:hypothetical protein|uniref:hypothetical protein n=1 Tax=Caldilinea sp. TaxID=2293560 RepID=UPI00258F8F87|nr:hypothetical protein [Caldilinea sp.]
MDFDPFAWGADMLCHVSAAPDICFESQSGAPIGRFGADGHTLNIEFLEMARF